MINNIASFTLLSLLLAITPGPDTFVVLKYSLSDGKKLGISTGAGASIGSLFWALLVALGLVTIMTKIPVLITIISILGGIYLFYLGISEIFTLLKTKTTSEKQTIEMKRDARSAFTAGLTSAVLNPKIGLFFLAIVPQFIPRDSKYPFWLALALGCIDTVIAFGWLSIVSLLAEKLSSFIENPRIHKILTSTVGIILCLLGIIIIAHVIT